MKTQKDSDWNAFDEAIRAALHDETSWPKLPVGLRSRLSARRGGLPRWLKVAAAIAALASFAALAAYVAVVETDETGDIAAESTEQTALQESNKEKSMIMARKVATMVGASMLSVAVPAAELTSEATFVFLRPETSSFWNTATNSTMTVPVDFPSGASSATLRVSGLDYLATYANITDEEFTFDLPAAESPQTENVYDLTLTFDDGTVRTAKLGLIQGLSPDSEGTTRCLAPSGSRVWNKVRRRAVLPIPYGTTSFTVNGVETDTDLGGAQGWFALGGINPEQEISLSLVADGVEYAASLLGGAGMYLILK